jgi:hypothetical protein
VAAEASEPTAAGPAIGEMCTLGERSTRDTSEEAAMRLIASAGAERPRPLTPHSERTGTPAMAAMATRASSTTACLAAISATGSAAWATASTGAARVTITSTASAAVDCTSRSSRAGESSACAGADAAMRPVAHARTASAAVVRRRRRRAGRRVMSMMVSMPSTSVPGAADRPCAD